MGVIAVEDLQRRNIISRDIKPDNYVLDHTGNIRMIDFGIAVKLKKGKPQTGLSCGTKSWRSPESVKSDKRKDGTRPDTLVGFPTDIWGLGSMLRWMCVGKHKRLNEMDLDIRQTKTQVSRGGLAENKVKIKGIRATQLRDINSLLLKLMGSTSTRTQFFPKIWESAFFKQFGGRRFRRKLIDGEELHVPAKPARPPQEQVCSGSPP